MKRWQSFSASALALFTTFAMIFSITFCDCATAEAAPTITTYNGEFASGLVGVRYVNKDAYVLPLSKVEYGNSWVYNFEIPMGVSFTLNTHSTGSHIGKYISGFFSVDLETKWTYAGTVQGGPDYSFEGTSNSGEGWTTGFYYNNNTKNPSVYLILDNYPLTYTDASQTHFRVDITALSSYVSTAASSSGTYTATLTYPGLDDYVLSTGPNVELSNIITNAITKAPVISDMAQVLEDIKSQDEQLFGDIVENLESQGVEMGELVDTSKDTNEKVGSIFDAILNLPELIANWILDGLKGLFIPDGEYFSNKFSEMNTFFSERFGFLYYPIDILIQFCNIFLTGFSGDVTIPFPEIAWEGHVIFSGQDVPILSHEEFKPIQDKLYFVGDVGIVGALITLSRKKIDEVMKT